MTKSVKLRSSVDHYDPVKNTKFKKKQKAPIFPTYDTRRRQRQLQIGAPMKVFL